MPPTHHTWSGGSAAVDQTTGQGSRNSCSTDSKGKPSYAKHQLKGGSKGHALTDSFILDVFILEVIHSV